MGSKQQQLIEQVTSIVRSRLADQGAGHGFDHIQRVWRTARKLQSLCGGNLIVVELSALLHDIGDAKFHDGKERSKEFSIEILTQQGVAESTVAHVAQIVDNISFRKRESAQALSLEGQVVQDADRLDALGAIGIVRTIEFGAAFGQPFYSPNAEAEKTGIGHFHEKLFKLRDLMNTDAGRLMAKAREDFMRSFVSQFELEAAGEG
ncbi:MAG: metal-dependent phosphohydrolase [Rhodopirellula sp.]|nr:metal-dependent phosphohydrolase [Rhodopirellula sp.]